MNVEDTISREGVEFDFDMLRNGKMLKEEYEREVASFLKLRDKYFIGLKYSHSPDKPSDELELRRSFFVQYDPKTLVGKLWLGDMDHYEIRPLRQKK
jgi:hypothetical protein